MIVSPISATDGIDSDQSKSSNTERERHHRWERCTENGWKWMGGVVGQKRGVLGLCFRFSSSSIHIHTFSLAQKARERERERERKKERRTDCSLSPSLWSFALSPPLFVDVCDAEVRNGNFDLVDEVYARRVLREQADQNS